MQTVTRSRLQLFIAAALFSTGGAAIKLCSFTGWQTAATRALVAGTVIFFALPVVRRLPTRKEFLAAFAYGSVMVTFVTSNKLTTAANAIYLQSTAPLYLVILAPILLKERIRSRDLLFLLLFAAGTVLLFLGEPKQSATATNPALGNIIAVVSGMFWALTVCGLRATSHGREDSSLVVIMTGNVVACAMCAIPALAIEPGRLLDWKGWLPILYLGIFQIALAYVFVTRAMKSVPALEASLLLMVEPVLNPVWAWLLNDERPDRWAIAGAGVILFVSVVMTWLDAKKAAELPEKVT